MGRFIVVSAFFVYRSFYGMRIESGVETPNSGAKARVEEQPPAALKTPAKAV